MTKSISKPKATTRSVAKKTAKSSLRKQSAAASSKLGSRSGTKHDRIIAMLRTPAGTTIVAITRAISWQQHSVRGFLAGVVRKKLRLNLVSELTSKGRLYRIKDGNATPPSVSRAKQAA